MARTLSSSISLVASAATCWGSVCSFSTMYLTGGPLMPPLSLTQEKYAWAMPVMPVKSVPGCLVTIAPSVRGAPVAFWPFPSPHLLAGAVLLLLVDPPVVLPLPHAAAAIIARELRSARAKAERGRLGPELVVIPLSWVIPEGRVVAARLVDRWKACAGTPAENKSAVPHAGTLAKRPAAVRGPFSGPGRRG